MISARRVSRDQLARRSTPVQTPESAQPAGLSSAGANYVLPALPATWAQAPRDLMREPWTRFSGEPDAEIRTSVRRGDGESAITPLLSVLLYRPKAFSQFLTPVTRKGGRIRNRLQSRARQQIQTAPLPNILDISPPAQHCHSKALFIEFLKRYPICVKPSSILEP